MNSIQLADTKNKLPGDYVAGFVDGEGCFYLLFRSEIKYKRKNQPRYFRWLPYFAMTVREDDITILQRIKNTLECGNVYTISNKFERRNMAYLGIQNREYKNSPFRQCPTM